MSPSSSMRRSGMSYLSAAMRSTPMPNAKPRVALGVDADVAEDVRVDHAAAEDLEPARCPCRTGSPSPPQMPQVTSTSALGSVNGKKCGRNRVRAVGTEDRLAEVVERALQVAEGDALVDDEPLDLRELRQVARVGDVSAIDLAGREHVDRRLLRSP